MISSSNWVWVPQLDTGHLPDILDLFKQAWWTKDRTSEQVTALLSSSQVFAGTADNTGKLLSCVRILSDGLCKAFILDLIVDEPARSQGIGRFTMNHVIQLESLENVADIELYCHHSLVPYYERFGFAKPPHTEFMRLSRRPIPSEKKH